LPELPPEPERPELRRSPSAKTLRNTTDRDRCRGDAYMDKVVADLEGVPSGGRNNALNHAAWTLGRWIAAGALERVLWEAFSLPRVPWASGSRRHQLVLARTRCTRVSRGRLGKVGIP
jgi:hypothetical protein